MEQLRFEIDELSRRIDEHLERSKQYRVIRGTVNNYSGDELPASEPAVDDQGDTTSSNPNEPRGT